MPRPACLRPAAAGRGCAAAARAGPRPAAAAGRPGWRARQVAGEDQGIGQRGLHQRREPRRAVLQRLLVGGDRLGIAALAGAHVAQHLARRAVHQRRFQPGIFQRQVGELLGPFELARVVEGDGEVAVGLAEQIQIAGLQGHVQGLAGRTCALAELAPLGQLHRLAAIGVAVQLDRLARVQRRAFGGQRQSGVGIVQPADGGQHFARLAGRIGGRRGRGLRRRRLNGLYRHAGGGQRRGRCAAGLHRRQRQAEPQQTQQKAGRSGHRDHSRQMAGPACTITGV